MDLMLTQFYEITTSYGVAILLLSIVVNTILLPLYYIAEKVQQVEIEARKRIQPRVERIKLAFQGEERFMMLSTLYKQNHYHPIFSLRSSLGLFLQVPFFIAAYHLLSHYTQINGVSFLLFKDLGASDGLLFGFNLLPFIMTGVNMLSALAYTKSSSRQDKIQLWSMAFLFLILLYDSPVALVYYWTINNIFSLLKNLLSDKMGSSVSLAKSSILINSGISQKVKKIISLVAPQWGDGVTEIFRRKTNLIKQQHIALIVASFFLVATIRVFNPLFIYFSSPERLGDFAALAVGRFLYQGTLAAIALYLLVFLTKKWALFYAAIITWLGFIGFIYSYIIHVDYGLFRGVRFLHEEVIHQTAKVAVLPELLLLPVVLLIIYRIFKAKAVIFTCFFLFTASALLFQLLDEYQNYQQKGFKSVDYENIQTTDRTITKLFGFSKKSKNIILLIPDATRGSLITTLFQEKPELAKRFPGFAIYPNTVAGGPFTLQNTASLIGGVDKTPYSISKKPIKPIMELIVEAYNDLVRIFDKHGYSINIFNPSYTNCTSINLEGHKCRYIHDGKIRKALADKYNFVLQDQLDTKVLNTFTYFKFLPLSLKSIFYQTKWKQAFDPERVIISTARYHDYLFLKNLKDASFIVENNQPQFTHLWTSDLIAPMRVGKNCAPTRRALFGVENAEIVAECYLTAIAEWIDWMKKNDVYDNTTIVMVADHGSDYGGKRWFESAVNPLLMVKDFNSVGTLKKANNLMYNADTLAILCSALGGCDGVTPDPRKSILSARKLVYSITSHGSAKFAKENNQFEIIKNYWITKDNLFNNTIQQDLKTRKF